MQDRNFNADAQRRLEVKIRTRKILAKTADKKEAREKALKDMNEKIKVLLMENNTKDSCNSTETDTHGSKTISLDESPDASGLVTPQEMELFPQEESTTATDDDYEIKLDDNYSHFSGEVSFGGTDEPTSKPKPMKKRPPPVRPGRAANSNV
jgi:hypothetical protein